MAEAASYGLVTIGAHVRSRMVELRAIRSDDTLYLMIWLMSERLRSRVAEVSNVLDCTNLLLRLNRVSTLVQT